jgi:hypothetical protein
MKKLILALFLTMLSILIIAPKSYTQELVCEEANGLNWCFNPNACGQACNDVCAAGGMQPIADNNVWFEAQNTEEECIAISQAFGLGTTVFVRAFGLGCVVDNSKKVHGAVLNPPLQCSTLPTCPSGLRTQIGDQGIPCESEDSNSRRAICPCEPLPPPPPPPVVPTLSEWGLIAMAGILGIAGFMVIRRRKLTA